MTIAIGLFLPLIWLALAVIKFFFWIPIENIGHLFTWPPLLWILGLALLSWILSGDRSR